MALLALFQYTFKEAIIHLYTDNLDVQNLAISVIWVCSISTFPDCYKGMLKGVVKALGIQNKAVYLNLSGHWIVNLSLVYVFAFYLNKGIIGFWLAKLVLEIYIFSSYLIMIQMQDWEKIIFES